MENRGAGWVVVQTILFGLFLFVPRIGPEWEGAIAVNVIGWLAISVGVTLLLWSDQNLGRSLTPFPRPLPHGQPVTRGAHGLVRHPIYSAVIIGAIGVSLVSQHWPRLMVCAVLFGFFDLKAWREEQWLTQQYPDYLAFQARVKKLIPWID